MDDLIVFDTDPTTHVASIRSMFERLRRHNLKLTPPKEVIGATEADFSETHHLPGWGTPQQ